MISLTWYKRLIALMWPFRTFTAQALKVTFSWMLLTDGFWYIFLDQLVYPSWCLQIEPPWYYLTSGYYQHTLPSIKTFHPWSNDQKSFHIHNHPYLPQTNFINHPQFNLYIPTILFVEFPQSMVHRSQDSHAPRNLIMHHINYLHIPMYPCHHPCLFPYHIHS